MQVELLTSGTQINIYDRDQNSLISFPALGDYSVYIDKSINEDYVYDETLDDLSFEKMVELEMLPTDTNPYKWSVRVSQKNEDVIIIGVSDAKQALSVSHDITEALAQAQDMEFNRQVALKMVSNKPSQNNSDDGADDDEQYF